MQDRRWHDGGGGGGGGGSGGGIIHRAFQMVCSGVCFEGVLRASLCFTGVELPAYK